MKTTNAIFNNAILISLAIIFHCLTIEAKQNIMKFDIRDGLSSNYIMSITEDKYGYIWFATEEGLTQMDGSSFKAIYKTEQDNSLPGNTLNAVLADKELPYVWIGTQRDGLSRYNIEEGTFKTYQHRKNDPQSIATNDITSLAHATNGKIWLGTFWRGIDLLDKKKETFSHFNTQTVKGLPENRVWCIADDGQGKLYVGHDRYGMSVIDIKKRTAYNIKRGTDDNSLPGNRVNRIVIDERGRVWIATDHGLAIYHPQEKRVFRFDSGIAIPEPIKSGNISTIAFIDGKMWISVELDGIYTIDLYGIANPTVEHIGYWFRDEDLSSPSVRSIFKDSFGNIWLGTWNGGLNFISDRKSMFNSIMFNPNPNTATGLIYKTVLGLCCDKNGRLWAGMDNGGIELIENNLRKNAFLDNRESTTDHTFITCKRSSNGTLWFGSYGGWIAITNENNINFKYVRLSDNNGKHADVRCFYEDINGNMLVGTGLGLFVLDESGDIIRHYDMDNSGISEDNVYSISRDSKGYYWVGTFGQGLTILTADMKRKAIYNTDNGFPSNAINHIVNMGMNRMAVATGAGLVVIDNDSLRIYDKSNGLVNDQVRAVATDNKKRLWISTNKGLAFIDGERVINFDNNDNIGYGEFSNAAVDTDSTGILYFGYNGGICHFNPMDIDAPQPELKLQFTSLQIYGETPSSDGTDYQKDMFLPLVHRHDVELNYRQSNISVGFNIRNYALDNEVEYSYRIREHGSKWHNVNMGRQVSFRNITPGSYTLEVRYRLRGGEWNKNLAILHITVAPPWWRSWWAIILYVILAISAILYNFTRYRRKLIRRHEYKMKAAEQQRQMEMNQEKLQFYINAEREARDKLAEKESLADNSEKRQQAAKYLQENDNQFIRQVASIISENMASGKLDISYIADKMNMSTSSLYRKMKTLTGMGSNEFISKVRMQEAEKMLIQGKYSISEVAFRLGFSTPAYFRHCFKDEFGMTPSEYVKNYTK